MVDALNVAMDSEVSGRGSVLALVPGGFTGWISWIPHAKKLSLTHKVVRVQLLSVALGLKNKPLPKNYSVEYEIQAPTNTS